MSELYRQQNVTKFWIRNVFKFMIIHRMRLPTHKDGGRSKHLEGGTLAKNQIFLFCLFSLFNIDKKFGGQLQIVPPTPVPPVLTHCPWVYQVCIPFCLNNYVYPHIPTEFLVKTHMFWKPAKKDPRGPPKASQAMRTTQHNTSTTTKKNHTKQ